MQEFTRAKKQGDNEGNLLPYFEKNKRLLE